MADKLKSTAANNIVKFIDKHDNFLLAAHVNADGDAIASLTAMNQLLKKMGKSAVMVLHDQNKDSRYNFLTGFEDIQFFSDSLPLKKYLKSGRIESAVLLDVPSFSRLGSCSKILPAKDKVIKIDHHPFEEEMGSIEWIDESYSSASAMVYEIIRLFDIDFDLPAAQAVYTGILYDTGRFSYSNTTAQDLFIASEMVKLGVNPAEITNKIFFENSFESLRTIGAGLASMESYLDGAVNVIYLNLSQMSGRNQNEIEELANYSAAVRNGRAGLFIREVEPGFHKISLRSKSDIDVNKTARVFNGGGHTRAAGCRMHGTKEEILQKILAEIKKQL